LIAPIGSNYSPNRGRLFNQHHPPGNHLAPSFQAIEIRARRYTTGSINQLNVATGEIFTLYLVVKNLQDDTGIGGFEVSLPVPEGVTQLQTTIYNVDSNTGTAPEIRVTLSEPLLWADAMVLAEIDYQAGRSQQQERKNHYLQYSLHCFPPRFKFHQGQIFHTVAQYHRTSVIFCWAVKFPACIFTR